VSGELRKPSRTVSMIILVRVMEKVVEPGDQLRRKRLPHRLL